MIKHIAAENVFVPSGFAYRALCIVMLFPCRSDGLASTGESPTID